MAELEPTSMEEDDERPDVLLEFERDLDEVCGGIQPNSRPHTPEWLASTSGRERVEPLSRGCSSSHQVGRGGSLREEISSGKRLLEVSDQGGALAGEKRPARTLHCRERGDLSGCNRFRTCAGRSRPGSRICGSAKGDDVAKGTSKRDKQDLGKSFQSAVSAHDWALAESFIPAADPQRLNDGLCIALDSVWFLSTSEELAGAMKLIEKLIEAGASDFTRAALRTSFLASCVSACRSRTMSLADTVTAMAQRLRERLQECNGDEVLKVEAAAKVQRFTEWALKCIGSHSRGGKGKGEGGCGSTIGMARTSSNESKLQLTAFKRFLQLAGDRLTEKDYTEAFDAACFPLTLFSSAIDPGWATGIAASAMQGLLGSLVEGGADNVNQCFLEAARFGSTELVRILLQIAFSKSVKLDVDLALGFASHYCKISTMECLVMEGNTEAFLGPLMRAAERGCMEVVQWFVERGCRDMELCLALTAAASSSRIDIAEYLLRHVPRHVLQTLSAEIIKAAGERSGGSLKGIAFLLQADFLNNHEATYKTADNISKSDDEAVTPELRAFLQEEWSEEAYLRGRALGQAHHLNAMRALKKGCSPLHLQELPVQLQVTVAYLPLYKECSASKGIILSQWLRGQLVEAVLRLNAGTGVSEDSIVTSSKAALLSLLESRLPGFLLTCL